MTAPTIKELIERATPGPWMRGNNIPKFIFAQSAIKGGSALAEVLTQDWDTNNPQITAEQGDANAQLIARCNPAVMAKVVEALEKSANRLKRFDLPAAEIHNALALLNGEQP